MSYNFINEYICKLDEKYRLKLPIELVRVMPEGERKMVLHRSPGSTTICYLKPQKIWDVEISRMRAKLNPMKPKHNRFFEMIMSGVTYVELDEKSDRITIPPALRDAFEEKGDVIVRGMYDSIFIQSKKCWLEDQANVMSDEDLDATADELS